MFPSHPLAALTLAAAATTALLAAPTAFAGPVRASASLTTDPAGVVSVTLPSGVAYAAYPNAQSPVVSTQAGRRHLVVDSRAAGHSSSFVEKYSGSADVSTSYALWNLTENRALTDAEALGLTLSFNFNLSGVTSTSGDAHERAVGLSGGLSYSAFPFAVGFGDNGSLALDPLGQVANGNQSLMAAVVDVDYALLHQDAAGGDVGFALSATTSLGGTAWYDLWLESVTLVSSAPAASRMAFASAAAAMQSSAFDLSNGLGVKLLGADAELIVVVPTATPPNVVSTPASWALVLTGLLLGGATRYGARGAASR